MYIKRQDQRNVNPNRTTSGEKEDGQPVVITASVAFIVYRKKKKKKTWLDSHWLCADGGSCFLPMNLDGFTSHTGRWWIPVLSHHLICIVSVQLNVQCLSTMNKLLGSSHIHDRCSIVSHSNEPTQRCRCVSTESRNRLQLDVYAPHSGFIWSSVVMAATESGSVLLHHTSEVNTEFSPSWPKERMQVYIWFDSIRLESFCVFLKRSKLIFNLLRSVTHLRLKSVSTQICSWHKRE